MTLFSLVIISFFGSVFPAVFLYAFVYEMRTGEEFAPSNKARSVGKENAISAALLLLAILSNLVLVAAGIAFFAEKVL